MRRVLADALEMTGSVLLIMAFVAGVFGPVMLAFYLGQWWAWLIAIPLSTFVFCLGVTLSDYEPEERPGG